MNNKAPDFNRFMDDFLFVGTCFVPVTMFFSTKKLRLWGQFEVTGTVGCTQQKSRGAWVQGVRDNAGGPFQPGMVQATVMEEILH